MAGNPYIHPSPTSSITCTACTQPRSTATASQHSHSHSHNHNTDIHVGIHTHTHVVGVRHVVELAERGRAPWRLWRVLDHKVAGGDLGHLGLEAVKALEQLGAVVLAGHVLKVAECLQGGKFKIQMGLYRVSGVQ